jgi:alpha-L-rhamnosidase
MITLRTPPTAARAVWHFANILIKIGCGLALAARATPAGPYAGSGLRVGGLNCEYLTNPCGIGQLQPRLNWVVESGERGQCQTAYRVLVAGSEAALKKDLGELWDSGRVASDQSLNVRYAGSALQSRQECFWKVCVWDQAGRRSNWSPPARWTMGLLQPADWRAKWIGKDEADKPAEPV